MVALILPPPDPNELFPLINEDGVFFLFSVAELCWKDAGSRVCRLCTGASLWDLVSLVSSGCNLI